ncbi:MAG: alanine racemase [Microbacterium sp.]|uniref:alanine racemase n=1 Tax=Microbacterium sp. TaxID=51671 RepID=UPI003F9DDDB4
MDELSGPVLRISRAQLARNISLVQAHLDPSRLMLVMKDEAYGHGIDAVVEVAQTGAGVTLFGGYDVATSLRIRACAALDTRIFAWATSDDDDVERALRADIDLGVGTRRYLDRVISLAEAINTTAKVHLKIDTGLRRNGILPADWPDVVTRAFAAQRAGTIEIVGAWSHLAEASDAEDDLAAAEFKDAVSVLRRAGASPQDLHLTASAASWWRPELRGSVCRVGAFCYGIRSADGPEIEGVRPIAALEAAVVDVEAESIRIGIGSLHGLPSTLVGAHVATSTGLREVLRIDDVTTTLRGWTDARVGEPVRLFGPGDQGEVDATTLAERIDTVGEEVITRLTSRVRRVMED